MFTLFVAGETQHGHNQKLQTNTFTSTEISDVIYSG